MNSFDASQIKAITFDLDDTLYDNVPVLKHAEAQFIQYLSRALQQPLTLEAFNQYKKKCVMADEMLIHDVVKLRIAAILLLLEERHYGFSPQHVEIAQQAMNVFIHYRSQIQLETKVHQLLARLKQNYRLGAITNGNADVEAMEIAHYFDFCLKAGADGLSKPHSDLFQKAEKIWQLEPSQLLHVGDNLETDVLGARNANWHSAWLCLDNAAFLDPDLKGASVKLHSILDLNFLR